MGKKVVGIGDVTRTFEVDAIATLINPAGWWFGGVDGAIGRVAGNMYHNQAREVLNSTGLTNGQAIFATGDSAKHLGNFNHVVFVVDDLKSPLGELVYTVLKTAHDNGVKSIALPLMRAGVMAGIVEPTLKDVVDQIGIGIQRFYEEADMDIYIVVWENEPAVKLLSKTMMLHQG